MPFTFSHPAIILVFSKIKHDSISMSALIIGSITPDFEYFIRMKLSGRYGHSIEGIFLFDLPIAFVIAIVFHQVLKKPFINNLPNYFYTRLSSLKDFNFPNYLGKHYWVFLGCLLTGIASHILWDSFTHPNTYLVNSIHYLSEPVTIEVLPEYPLFRYLQHASTAIGAFFILLFFHHLPVQQQKNELSFKFWLISIVIAGIAFALRASLTFEYFGDVVATIISSGFIGLIFSSIFYRFYAR